jgi:hypothetical protein
MWRSTLFNAMFRDVHLYQLDGHDACNAPRNAGLLDARRAQPSNSADNPASFTQNGTQHSRR